MTVKLVQLPFFQGFYHTIFDIFDTINIVDSEDESDGIYNVTQEEYDDFDFLTGYKKLAKDLVNTAPYESLLNEIGISIIQNSEQLVSPKFYNHVNDKIFVSLDVSDEAVTKLIDFLLDAEEDFEQYYMTKYEQELPFMAVQHMVKKLEDGDLESANLGDILEAYITYIDGDFDTLSWVSDKTPTDFLY